MPGGLVMVSPLERRELIIVVTRSVQRLPALELGDLCLVDRIWEEVGAARYVLVEWQR